MLWKEYRPVIKIGTKGALGSYEIRPIHSASSLGQSIVWFLSELTNHATVPFRPEKSVSSAGLELIEGLMLENNLRGRQDVQKDNQ